MAFDIFEPATRRDPYPTYAALRRDKPVHWVEALGGYVVSRHADIKEILRDSDTYSSGLWMEYLFGDELNPVPEVSQMVGTDAPYHGRLRNLANQAFTPAKIRRMEDDMQSSAHMLLDDIVTRHGTHGTFDFVWEFAALFPVGFMARMLDIDPEKRLIFKHWIDDLLAGTNRDILDEAGLNRIRKSRDEIREYFETVYQQRLTNPGNDVVSSLIMADVEGGKLKKTEVLAMMVLLLMGGGETTSSLLSNIFVIFKDRPEVYEEVKADPGLINSLIQETLRFYSPILMTVRQALRDVSIAGTAIDAGSRIFCIIGSGNRDERVFDNPDSFDIHRNHSHLIAFGQGIHFCLGHQLARLEAKVALNALFERFEMLQPVTDEVEWVDSVQIRAPATFPLSFNCRAPAPAERAGS